MIFEYQANYNSLSINDAQNKLELITGIPAANQAITLLASESDPRVLAQLTEDSRPLGYYGIADWQVLKVSKIYCALRNLKMVTMSSRLLTRTRPSLLQGN
jgi:hypothetical protein